MNKISIKLVCKLFWARNILQNEKFRTQYTLPTCYLKVQSFTSKADESAQDGCPILYESKRVDIPFTSQTLPYLLEIHSLHRSLRGRRKKGRGEGGGRKGKGKGAPALRALSPIPLPFFPSSLSPTPYPLPLSTPATQANFIVKSRRRVLVSGVGTGFSERWDGRTFRLGPRL